MNHAEFSIRLQHQSGYICNPTCMLKGKYENKVLHKVLPNQIKQDVLHKGYRKRRDLIN